MQLCYPCMFFYLEHAPSWIQKLEEDPSSVLSQQPLSVGTPCLGRQSLTVLTSVSTLWGSRWISWENRVCGISAPPIRQWFNSHNIGVLCVSHLHLYRWTWWFLGLWKLAIFSGLCKKKKKPEQWTSLQFCLWNYPINFLIMSFNSNFLLFFRNLFFF